MDRDTLLTLLANLNDDTLCVRVDGTLVDADDDEHDPDDVEAAVEEMKADLETLLAWAKSAPKRQPVAA